MGKLSRTKGHSEERFVVKDLRELFPKAKRHLEYQSQEAEAGQDLDNTYPFLWQIKRYKKYINPSKIEEIKKITGQYPILYTRADNKKAIVCMYYEDWKELVQMLKSNNIL